MNIVTIRKLHSRINLSNVPKVFNSACIKRLATISKLPPGADTASFGAGIREAARIYARDSQEPNVNQLHDEISALHARSRVYESDRFASAFLDDRAAAPSPILAKSKAQLRLYFGTGPHLVAIRAGFGATAHRQCPQLFAARSKS